MSMKVGPTGEHPQGKLGPNDEGVVGLWYLSYCDPLDAVVVLQRLNDRYQITMRVKMYGVGNQLLKVIEHQECRPLCRLSLVIECTRDVVKECGKKLPVAAQWEVLRGGRSLQEFVELLMSMPNAKTRMASPDEVQALNKMYGGAR